jgi:uncharacterized membrane-anchored protein
MTDAIAARTDGTKMAAMLNKVPEVTAYFWIIKVLCTTVGETASDFLNVNLNFGLVKTSIVAGVLFAIALAVQLRTRKYVPGVYWVTVVLISVFGTLVTDNLTDGMHVPLEFSTVLFSVLLAAAFGAWYASERTLSIHSIVTTRRECFYWLAILFTFALGTASGDLMAESLGLGYAVTGFIVCGVIAAAAIAWRLGLHSILAFWIIYIMTRPLGASLGDYLSQPAKYGGLGLGATATSAIFLSAILATVTFLSLTKRDRIAADAAQKEEEETRRPGALRQVAAVLAVLLIASGAGYRWRQAALRAQSEPSLVAAAATSVDDGGTPAAPARVLPLGDLTSFRAIVQDTSAMVDGGKLADARTRVGDLEYEWDNAEARLKPMDRAKWSEMDGAIDRVLRDLRAVHQDASTCASSLQALRAIIDADS